MSLSKLTKYCACHEKWISWLILVTHETLFTMRGVTTVIVQTHQILRLPRKMNLMILIDPCHTWNAIYNARSNKCHCPNSPNTAPATKSNTHHWSLSHMKRYLQRAEQQVSLSKLTKYCACHAKWLILVTYETLFTMRGTTGGILQHHQMVRLPRKMTVTTDPRHIWNAIYNARNNRCHPPTSPNTAPATQNDWSSSHMKRYLQCAEQQVASSNITKYCACHAKWLSNISKKFLKNSWNVISNAGPIREWSEHDPSNIRAGNRPPQPASQQSWLFALAFSIEKYNISCSGYHSKFHRILPLPRQMTLELHQILRLPRKMTVMTDPRHIWNAIYNARNNRSHPPTSPNTAPATQNDSPTFQRNFSKTAETSFPMRGRSENDPSMIRATSEQETVRRNPPRNRGDFSRSHFLLKNTTFRAPAIIPNFTEYCACHEKWQFNIPKYCACHAK